MRRKLRIRSTLLLAAAAFAATGAGVAQEQSEQQQAQQQEPEQQQPVSAQVGEDPGARLPPGQFPGVLKSREVDFIYRSTTSILSCDQLRRSVAVVLVAVGARNDVKVDARDCEAFLSVDPRAPPRSSDPSGSASGTFGGSGYDPANRTSDRLTERARMTRSDRYNRDTSQTTSVHIQVMMPVVVTPEIVAEIDRDKSRRELISRVTGNASAAFDDAIFFPAERRDVTLSHDTIDLEAIDCEVLEQMATSVFRELDLKVRSQALSCDPRGHFKPRMAVEALLPVGVLMPGEQKEKDKKEKYEKKHKKQGDSEPEAGTPPSQ